MVLIKNPRLPAAIGLLLLGIEPGVNAQTPAEHGSLAHGHPIIKGKDIQPTPQVVEERLRHHRLMLQAERERTAGLSAAKRRASHTGTPAKTMDGEPP